MGQTGKSRSHSFSGCWTCRRRRVKCDAGVPNCKRCSNAGLNCEGYGFRFDIPEGVQSSRQSLPADSRPDLVLRLTNDEIDEHLADIEIASGTLHKGPFSLIDFSDALAANELRPQRLPSRSRSVSSTTPFSTPQVRRGSGSTTANGSSNGAVEYYTPPQQPRSPQLTMELSMVKLLPHEQRLFHHFVHFVTDQLSPLAGFVCSAYETIVPSIAISGQTSHNSYDASAAVFHGVCGVAATNLFAKSPNNQGYQVQALHHENLALRHLRRSIETGTDAYVTLAVAIMLLLLFEHLSGRAREYRAHIQAGLRCLVLSEQRNPHNTTTAIISEQFLLACALGNIVPSVRVGSLRRNLTDGRVGYFEQQAGMALGMLDIIISINECYAQNGTTPPETVHEIRMQLALHAPPENPTDSLNFRTGALAYYATCIYFARAVRQCPADHPDVLWAVDRAIQQLEAMNPKTRELNNCVIAWAGCLLGSECELEEHKQRFMAWCNSKSARDMMNLAALTMVSQYSWKMKAEMPEKYRLLWYQFEESMDERMWYPDQPAQLELQYTPGWSSSGDGTAIEEPSLTATLSCSEELSPNNQW